MSRIEVDWTVDDIPDERELGAQSTAPVPPNPPASPPPWRWPRLNRRRLFWLTILAVGLGGGVGAIIIYGWWQLHTQVQAQINYEDTRAFAQDTASVRAMLEDNAQWADWRTAEVELGLPAPRPLPNLVPEATPGKLVNLTARTETTFDAQVVRLYTDAAGQPYEFLYEQRYRQLQPGVWQRLAPSAASAQQKWEGQYLYATYFAADEAWLQPQLLIIDDWLAQACQRWGCPAKQKRLQIRFSSDLHSLPRPTVPVRATDLPTHYPLVFDLPVSTASDGVLWPAPALAGRPHNEAAIQLYTRMLGVALMSELADQLSFSTRTPSNHFLDALIARAEIDLGISPAPNYEVRPQNFLPPEQLWSLAPIARVQTPEVVQARLQTLAFLNFALTNSGLEAERRLLYHLRRQSKLTSWLAQIPGVDAPALIEQWEASARGQFHQHPPDWPSLEGLVYQCPSGIYIARAEGPQVITKPNLEIAQPMGEALSPEGRYVAVIENATPDQYTLQVLDLQTNRTTALDSVSFSGGSYLLGWSQHNELWFGAYTMYGWESAVLKRYTPGNSAATLMTDSRFLMPFERLTWDAPHTQFALDGADGLTLMQATPPFTEIAIASRGASPMLAATDHEVFYARTSGYLVSPQSAWIVAQALTSTITRTLATVAHARFLILKDRSNDGQWLAFTSWGESPRAYLYALTTGQLIELPSPRAFLADDVRLAFSADSQYLSLRYYRNDETPGSGVVRVLNLSTQTSQSFEYQAQNSENFILTSQWSPIGHRLAMNGPLGLYVVDAATGDYQWLSDEQCEVGWRRFP